MTFAALGMDPRLDARGATLIEYKPAPGETFWKLVDARWQDESESQGKHHIEVNTLDIDGRRLADVPVLFENGGTARAYSELKPGERASANFPMFASGWGYSVRIDGKSDRVARLGQGTLANPHEGAHTGYFFVFRRTFAGPVTPPPPTEPPPLPPADMRAELTAIVARLQVLVDRWAR